MKLFLVPLAGFAGCFLYGWYAVGGIGIVSSVMAFTVVRTVAEHNRQKRADDWWKKHCK